MQHATDWAPGIRQITRFADPIGLDNPDKRANCANMLHGGEGPSSRKQEQTKEHVMMVESWPCRVSSEIHINGLHVSYPVREDKGKAVATGQEDKKDPKRARVVASQGHEVVRPGCSMMSSAATTGKDMGRRWDNPNWITQVTDKGRNPDNSNRVSSIEQERPDHT
jgi:hypothetical protein